jgi:hypothetical protein
MIAAESQRGRRVTDKRSGKRLIKSIARVKKALEAEFAELRRICSPRFPASVRSLRAP